MEVEGLAPPRRLPVRANDEEGRIAALGRYQVLDSAPEQAFDKITALVQSVLEVPICAVSLIDRERQWFKSVQGLNTRETPREDSFCTHTIKRDDALVVPDAHLDDRFRDNALVVGDPNIRSYAGIPLRTSDGYNVGSLCAIDTRPRAFSAAQIDILRSFAALVTDELELRLIAERDHLTGAATRRRFIEEAKKEIARFARHGRHSVLVLLDVDHFKAVNDRHGHPAGDEVLKAVAQTCQAHVRGTDCFGRLGGEEFGLLLHESDRPAALAAAEKLRAALAAKVVHAGAPIRITASFGLAGLGPSLRTPEAWIARADEALYEAKRTGRDRCVWHGEIASAAAA